MGQCSSASGDKLNTTYIDVGLDHVPTSSAKISRYLAKAEDSPVGSL